ncbi:hypothetical protein pipiens_012500 [Culex pipiens pipiens]|uniref:Uncharacterized protein n=1 Tax=Culex pipiens pipiens TaxID=38569 RepID=A0ABD1D228_CULPP
MARLLCGVLIVLTVNSCRADFGLNLTVPNLIGSIQSSIGAGITPLLRANSTIAVQVSNDRSGALAAVVSVTNAINAGIPAVFTNTLDAAKNSGNSPLLVFSDLFGTNNNARIKLLDAIAAAELFKNTVSPRTYQAIVGNVTVLQQQLSVLTSTFIQVGSAVDRVLFSKEQVDGANIGNYITPAMVNRLSSSLALKSASISNLGSLFSTVIRVKTTNVRYVSNFNNAANTALRVVSTQLDAFTRSLQEVAALFVGLVIAWANDIHLAYNPVTADPSYQNETFTESLLMFLNEIRHLNVSMARNLTRTMQNLDGNITNFLASQAQTTADTVYQVVLDVTKQSATTVSDLAENCSQKYIYQLLQPALQVNRLSGCLFIQSSKFVSLDHLLKPVLGRIQSDATGIRATCSSNSLACSAKCRIQICSEMWSALLLSLGLFASGSRADLGLSYAIPNLVANVQAAIGQGIAPVTNANATIRVDVGADVSGALEVVVAISNAINSSIGSVFQTTQKAASEASVLPAVVFGKLYGTVINAKLELEQANGVVQQLQSTVSDQVYDAIVHNLTKLHDDLDVLTLNYIALGTAVNVVVATTILPITSLNVVNIVKPALVEELTTTLRNISTSVASLGGLFTEIVKQKTAAVTFVSSTNSTANAALTTLVKQLTNFTSTVVTAGDKLRQVASTLSSNVAAVHVPITGASVNYNGGNIVNLTQYLDAVVQSTQQLSQNLSNRYQDLQNNVQQVYAELVDVATRKVYSVSLGLAQKAATSASSFVNNCYQKYNFLLQQPSLHVARLNTCLLPEADSFTKLQKLLDCLLAQFQSDASAITNTRLNTCTTLNGACSLTYFSAYADLALQTDAQLTLTNNVIATEARAITNRIRTCVVATVADINDNAQQILTNFNGCLVTGQ